MAITTKRVNVLGDWPEYTVYADGVVIGHADADQTGGWVATDANHRPVGEYAYARKRDAKAAVIAAHDAKTEIEVGRA